MKIYCISKYHYRDIVRVIATELEFTKTKVTFFYMRHNIPYKTNVIDVNRLLQKNLKTKSIFRCKLKRQTDKNRWFFKYIFR